MGEVDRGEPVDLLHEYGKRLVRCWRRGRPQLWDEEHLYLGVLADGRWYVQYHHQARAYRTAPQARQVAGQLMATVGEGWVEEPCGRRSLVKNPETGPAST